MENTDEDIETQAAHQMQVLCARTADVISKEELTAKIVQSLKTKTPLRVKLGIDPSGTELTLGHAVVLRKLREFQNFGHTAVLIFGDFTGQIGDPTGRAGARVPLTLEQTRANAKTYLTQASLILDVRNLEVHFNSRWLSEYSLSDFLSIGQKLTVSRILEREDFSNRLAAGTPVSLTEITYPILQGLDSVHVTSDVELGGTDQTLNTLMGRVMQKNHDQTPQVVITSPILDGINGVGKMGKSAGNFVALTEAPGDQYGKLMSIPDTLLDSYGEHAAFFEGEELEAFKALVDSKPFDAKKQMAHRVVELYHNTKDAEEAAAQFVARFSKRQLPEPTADVSVEVVDGHINIVEVLVASGLCSSKGDARRVLSQGGVRVNGRKLEPVEETITGDEATDAVLQRGKLHAVRLKPS